MSLVEASNTFKGTKFISQLKEPKVKDCHSDVWDRCRWVFLSVVQFTCRL